MKRILTTTTLLAGLTAAAASTDKMQVSANGTREAMAGSQTSFIGNVTVTPLFAPSEHSNAGGGQVEFAPGARSNWHTHPAGQILIVTAGSGWVQEDGGEKIVIKPGDVIWTPPGVKHWHGATATRSMTHIAITPVVESQNVTWLEQVSDEQYR